MSAAWQSAALLAAATLLAPPPPRARLRPVPAAGRRPHPATAVAVLSGVPAVAVVAAAGAAGVLTGPLVVAVALAAATAAARRRRRNRTRCRRAEGRALAQALEIMVGEVRAGAHPVNAVTSAADEAVGPVGSALRAVAGRARLGADPAEGMRVIAADSAVGQYWRRLAVCWDLAAVHGLPMAALLQAAQRDIADRQIFADRMTAALAGPRATATILAGLPVLGVLLGELLGAHPVRFLVSGPPGGWLLMIGTALLCAGITWSDRITDGVGR